MKKETKLQAKDFTNKELFVGLDVHGNSWSSKILVEGIVQSYNCPADPSHLRNHLREKYPNAKVKIAYEAGCFGFVTKEYFDKEGLSCIVVNPADIPTSHKDKVSKTDARDSLKVALALKGGMLQGIYHPDKDAQEARSLLRRREDLVRKSTRVKNQIKSMLKFFGIAEPEEFSQKATKWSKAFIKWLSGIKFKTSSGNIQMASYLRELEFLKAEKKDIQKHLAELMKSDRYKEESQILASMPGIGGVAAATILLEVDNFARFESTDKYVSFLGLIPTEHSSGEKQKTGNLIRRCNKPLRKVYIEAAWTAIRYDPAMKEYFAEKIKTMKKTKAIICVARKLASRTMYLVKHKMKYVKALTA
jgi:transposase